MEYKFKNKKINLDFVKLAKKELSLPYFAGAVLSARGINTIKDTLTHFSNELDLNDPLLMASMPEAVNAIIEAIKNNTKIAIFGDFDTDGITSTAILARFFKKLEYENIKIVIPKEADGHGLSKQKITELINEKVGLIITVDNGTNAKEEIILAEKNGVRVVVTDHHLPDANYAIEATAILNPNRPDCPSEFKGYSGGGMALILCIAVARTLKREDYISDDLFVLATISSIADMVPLVGDNRKLIKFGLKKIKDSKILGLSLLLDKLYMSGPEELSARDVAFRIAPLINAAGKFGLAESAFCLLTAGDRSSLHKSIKELLEISSRRRELLAKASIELSSQVNAQSNKTGFIFVFGNHRSAINGLLATRIMQDKNLPTFVGSEDGDILRISGRSNGKINLSYLIDKTKHIHLGGGGHAFAAGIRVEKTKLPFLLKEFESLINELTSEKEAENIIEIDGQLTLNQITVSLINSLRMISPFGKQNEPPIFLIRGAEIKKEIIGSKVNHYVSSPAGKIRVNFTDSTESAEKTLGGANILFELNFFGESPLLYVKKIEKE